MISPSIWRSSRAVTPYFHFYRMTHSSSLYILEKPASENHICIRKISRRVWRIEKPIGLTLISGADGDTSADALITVPVVDLPWIRPRLTPSEGLKYPAAKTHLPPLKADWLRISRTCPTPVVSVDSVSSGDVDSGAS